MSRLHAMRCDAMRCDAMRCDATRRDATRRDATRRDAMRSDAMRCDATRQDATRRDAVRCGAVQCGAVWCDTQYDTMRHNTIQYTAHDITYTVTRHWKSCWQNIINRYHMIQYRMVQFDMAHCGDLQYDTVQQLTSTIPYHTIRYTIQLVIQDDTFRYDTIQWDAAKCLWHDAARYDTVRHHVTPLRKDAITMRCVHTQVRAWVIEEQKYPAAANTNERLFHRPIARTLHMSADIDKSTDFAWVLTREMHRTNNDNNNNNNNNNNNIYIYIERERERYRER